MVVKTTYLQERPENFDQWLNQLASERGYNLSVSQQGNYRQYQVKRDDQAVAQIETFPVGDRLRLRAERKEIEIAPNGKAEGGFLQILSAELVQDYQAEPIENGIDFLTYWIADSFSDVQFDDPKEEAKRQALVAELRRGLPPIAPTEPAPMREQAQGTTPNVERKYRTTRETLERVVRDFTRKWLGDSAQRAPFADVRVESIGQVQIEIQGKCESPKGLENAFEYLPMVKLTPTIINADWLKVEAWAMNGTENPDAKKTVDNFLASLIRELDHYLGDAPNVTTPTMQAQLPDATQARAASEFVEARMLIIPTGLENAIRNVKNLDSEFAWGLTWHGQKHGAAVWSVGNCLITLLEQTETTTEIAHEVFRPRKYEASGLLKMDADDKAREVWSKLTERLRRNRLAEVCPDSERVANETLKQWDYDPATRAIRIARRTGKPIDVEQAKAEIQAELAKFADKTPEQVAAEYFARFDISEQATKLPMMQAQATGATPTEPATMRAQSHDVTPTKRGMTEERQRRAETFKKIKDEKPERSYNQVAIRAREMGYPDASEDDVRNDYRAMGWDWERADRAR